MWNIIMLIVKNSLRHKLRASLTIIGIAIAVVAFGLLRTVVTAWNAGVDMSSANRLISRQAVSFIFTLPYSYRDKISKLDGVETVSYLNWFGGVYIDKNQFFARMACDPETVFSVYPEFVLSEREYAEFRRERNSCVIGADIAKQYNLKIGDVMTMDGDIYPGKWQFTVRGIYQPRDKTVDGTQMLFHWNYLEERIRAEDATRAGQIGWFVVKIKDPNRSAEISEQIDALFRNSRAETKTETERAFQQGFVQSAGAIIEGINIMSFVIIGIILLVLGNTMAMSARERTREYAVMKTLGFTAKHLIMFIAGESMMVASFGAGLGLFLLAPMIEGFALAIPKGFFPVFYLEKTTVILAVSSALFVGICASIVPMIRALKTSIVDGLRFIG